MQNSAGIILVIILCLVVWFFLWSIYEGKRRREAWERFELERERTLTGDREQADRLKGELAETLVRVQELRRELEQERGRTREQAKKESTFFFRNKKQEHRVQHSER